MMEIEVVDKAEQMAKVEAFSHVIKKKIDAAIEGRKSSGIEEIWQEDEEFYEGNDSAEPRQRKSKTLDSGLMQTHRRKVTGRSNAFVGLTRQYCDAASARISDMLIPTDERNWDMKSDPVPELIDYKQSKEPVFNEMGEAAMVQKQPNAPPEQMNMGDIVQAQIKEADDKAEKAKKYIDDWLTECSYNGSVRKMLESVTKLGTGIIKGPVPVRRKSRAVIKDENGFKVVIEVKTVPASEYVNVWNFYPDPNCGDDISNGEYVCERGEITESELLDLKQDDGYIPEMIDLCVEEGPINTSNNGRKELKKSDSNRYTIWYFYGQVSKKDMEAAECECEKQYAPCIVTLVNDRIIKIALSPLDTGDYPYDVMVWQAKHDHWAGIGVARQMRTSQKGINGATRAMSDNAAISSGAQIIIDTSKMEPADGKWEITPNKLWRKIVSADEVGDVRQAFTTFNIETRQGELLNIIQFWAKMAEDVTGLPMLLQGQQGTAPQTVGGMTMLINNANSVLRRIARTFDDRVTTRHINRYYEWLLLYGEDNDTKGAFHIEARGSSALVERDIQNQALLSLLNMSANPAFELDPKELMREVLKSMRLDSKHLQLSDEKRAEMQQSQQPQVIPQLEVEKLRQQTDLQKTQLQIQGAAQIKQVELQQDQAQFQSIQELEQMKLQVEKMRIEVDAQLGAAELDASQRMALDNIKADLSGIQLKLQTQKELSAQVIAPASEPAGRAPNGMAFQR